MTVDRWTLAVRQQLSLGRLLPLGRGADGSWIAERAAAEVLRDAAAQVPGVRLGSLRLDTTGSDGEEAAVPAPPSALPPGPVRLTADFAATAREPLPAVAERLRAALLSAADRRIGLTVSTADLRVTGLVTDPETAGTGEPPQETAPPQAPAGPLESAPEPAENDGDGDADSDEAAVARAVRAVPGVAALTGEFGGLGRAVRIDAGGSGTAPEAAVPRRHIRIELATGTGHRTLDVALAAREAAASAVPDTPTVAALITAVTDAAGSRERPPGA